MRKRLVSVLITFALFFTLTGSVPVMAAEIVDSGYCGDNVRWSCDSDGLLTISGTGAMYNFQFDDGEDPVVYMPGWFERILHPQITSIIVEDGVSAIGSWAFGWCTAVRTISIPSSVTKIGHLAFCGCNVSDIFFEGTEQQWNSASVSRSEIGLYDNVVVHFQAGQQKAASWNDAYQSFILDSGYLRTEKNSYYTGNDGGTGNLSEPSFALHDMDRDGTPELIANNGLLYTAAVEIYLVYTFIDGEVKLVGQFEGYSVHYDPTLTFPGLFTFFSHMFAASSTYHSIQSGQIQNELVNEVSVEGNPAHPFNHKTNNDDLYAIGHVNPENGNMNDGLRWLQMYFVSDIQNIGWDAFVNMWAVTNIEANLSSFAGPSLETFLYQFGFGYTCYQPNTLTWETHQDYNATIAGNAKANLVYCILTNPSCATVSLYTNAKYNYQWGEKDPLGWYETGVSMMISAINWIATNIFNLTETDIKILVERGEGDHLFYQYGDLYYFPLFQIGDVGGRLAFQSIKEESGYYYLCYNEYREMQGWEDRLKNGTYYALVAPKKIDGKAYWSLYAFSENPIDYQEIISHYNKQANQFKDTATKYVYYSATLPSGFRAVPNTLPSWLTANGEILQGMPVEAGTFTFSITDETETQEAIIVVNENGDTSVNASVPDEYEVVKRMPDISEPGEYKIVIDEVNPVSGAADVFDRLVDVFLDGRKLKGGKISVGEKPGIDWEYYATRGSVAITLTEQCSQNAGNGTHTLSATFHNAQDPGKTDAVSQNFTTNIEEPEKDFADKFPDAKSTKYRGAVWYLTQKGIIDGYEDGYFHPERNLTRAQASKLIALIINGSSNAAASPFMDIAGHWAERYIKFCAEKGIVGGYGNGIFGPDDTITGYAWAKMLFCANGFDEVSYGMTGSAWESGTRNLIINRGMDLNMSNFQPQASITREEACQMAYNIFFQGISS